MSITCTRKLHWSMGHRLVNHEGGCAHLHGHNYRAEITAIAQGHLDNIGRVIDFSVLKQVYDTWIQKEWDHGFLLNIEDKPGIQAMRAFLACPGASNQKFRLVHWNPTAENIAKFLGTHTLFVQALARHDVKIHKVVVHETDNCFSTWEK